MGPIAAVAAIALVVALTGLDIRLAHENAAPASQFETLGPVHMAEAAASLTVLPFKNLSAEEDDGFTDGLSIDIASVFERTGVFKMPSMTSTFRFKGRGENSRAIGQALNVDYLLEGTVLRAGDDLTIAASLVRAEDGFLIWSQTYRQTLGEVFEVQEAIAKAIGEALATPLKIDSDILKAERTDDPQAYELCVRGQALLEQRGLALQDAMAVLERAVEIKPDFAAAWGALSLVYNVIPSFVTEINGRPVNAVIFYRRAKEAALTAQRIDPDLPVVRHALGSLYLRERQWAGAQDALEAALRNDPYAHRVMLTYGALLYTVGKRNEARAFIDQAREIDPLNELYNLWAAFMRW
jgi:TolB-like protein